MAEGTRGGPGGKVESAYYVSLVAMMGYAFGVGKVAGLVTLGTFVLSLGAIWYSYSQVGHGRGRQQPATGGRTADDQVGV